MPRINNIDMSKEVHSYIKRVAKARGRSLKQQLEFILENSCDDDIMIALENARVKDDINGD